MAGRMKGKEVRVGESMILIAENTFFPKVHFFLIITKINYG